MISFANNSELDKIENLLGERGLLIEQMYHDRDSISYYTKMKRSSMESLLTTLQNKERELKLSLEDLHDRIYHDLNEINKRKLISNYIQQG